MELKYIVPLIILIFMISCPVVAGDSSLWTDEAADLYEDRPEYMVGDIITVVIEEDASAIQSANTSTSQENDIEAGGGTGFFDFIKSFGFSYSDSDSADGQTERSGTLKADITTQVDKVLKNGNFRIEGTKKIKINGEEQIIKLSGVIRPDDISLENTVSSKKVANADIEYEGQGNVSEKQKPGLLTRLMNWIF